MSESPADRRFRALEAFLAADPNDSFSRYALAMEFRSRGDTPNAIIHLEELRRRDPNYLALYYPLGGLYADSGRRDDALGVYAAGIAVGRAQKEDHAVAELEEAREQLG